MNKSVDVGVISTSSKTMYIITNLSICHNCYICHDACKSNKLVKQIYFLLLVPWSSIFTRYKILLITIANTSFFKTKTNTILKGNQNFFPGLTKTNQFQYAFIAFCLTLLGQYLLQIIHLFQQPTNVILPLILKQQNGHMDSLDIRGDLNTQTTTPSFVIVNCSMGTQCVVTMGMCNVAGSVALP